MTAATTPAPPGPGSGSGSVPGGGSAATAYPFVKGHGTHNDFVILPDHDCAIHGDLPAERVRALCDRRGGIGADGVLRVVRASPGADAPWFMDYRNADGSLAQMCGNGVRVFVLHLIEEGLVDPSGAIAVGTRDGTKVVHVVEDGFQVDMGVPKVLGESEIGVGGRGLAGRQWAARHVDLGNPHAVVMVPDLDFAGTLTTEPDYDDRVYPEGVNIEFVVRRGAHHLAMRVHERGSGETRSCGTGACAAMVVAGLEDGDVRDVDYRVDLPGGTLLVRRTAEDRVVMRGPAELVARGTTCL